MMRVQLLASTVFVLSLSNPSTNNVVSAFSPASNWAPGQRHVLKPIKQHESSFISSRQNTNLRAFVDFDTSVLDSASTFLSHGSHAVKEVHEHVEQTFDGPIDALLHDATLWSVIVMLSIVSLLLAWEESVKTLRENIPPALKSVVDSMLSELGGIGFIGLFLQIFITGGEGGLLLGALSERFLGEEDILLETFEFLHTVFFEVGVGFFTVSGLIVAGVLNRIQRLEEISLLAIDTDGDGEVSLEELAAALKVESVVVDANGDGVLDDDEIADALRNLKQPSLVEEIFMGQEERTAEVLVVRERLLENSQLDDEFLIEAYFEEIFAHNLEEIVELSPVTWLPLIPILALCNSVDISHEVISASSQNAAMTSGLFIATPWFLYPSIFLQALCVAWGLTNLWKFNAIKNMLLPTLVRDGVNGPATLLPPRFQDPGLRRMFSSTPAILKPLENFFRKPPRNDHESLFGDVGAAGPSFYRNSFKFQVWLCVAQIVFYGTQIVGRDAWALLNPSPNPMIGSVSDVFNELGLYSFMVVLSIAQLALAPTTFIDYCFITSVEELTKDWAIEKAISTERCLVPESVGAVSPNKKQEEPEPEILLS